MNVLNTFIAWRLFGASLSADVWLLSVATIGTLNILALIGVEQFLYCYTAERCKGPKHARDFAKTVLLWSLLSGVAFAGCCAAAMPVIVELFAGGMQASGQDQLFILLMAMLPQTAAAPCLHVVRQLLNAHEQYVRGYVLSMWAPAVQLAALTIAALLQWKLEVLAIFIGCGAVLQMILCFYVAREWRRGSRYLPNMAASLRDMVWKSASMRSAHALHNFLSLAIISGALSSLSVGGLAVFMYAKRIAEGLSSIAVGPHLGIYHAKLAHAWVNLDRRGAVFAAQSFCKHVMPLYLVCIVAALLILPGALRGTAMITSQDIIKSIMICFALISMWNILIIIESVSVAVLMTNHRAAVFAIVNSLFILVFYGLSRLPLDISATVQLPLVGTVAQCISLVIFATIGFRTFTRHFYKASGRYAN